MTKAEREKLIAEWIGEHGVRRLPYMGKHASHEAWEKLEAAKDFERWRRQCRKLSALS